MPFTAGIDIGASATKAAILAGQDPAQAELIGAAVLRSGVDFALSARQAFEAALAEAGIEAGQVQQVFSCGYGRDNVGFAHQTRTEIAAHGAAAFRHFPRALTVLDIGGQDNKVIKLDEAGRRVSFRMNRKCAAGTGAFLEEMALRLGVGLEEFDSLARSAAGEVTLGSYCTVFSATEVLAHIRKGVALADLVKGLFRSVLNRVMEMDALSETVVMTGGVAAHNPYLVQMLSEMLGRPALTPPRPQLAGAEGAAFIVEKPFVEGVDSAKDDLETIGEGRYFYLGEGAAPAGDTRLEDLFATGSTEEPPVAVGHEDTWIIMYTSGTTGRPKGVVRTHESLIAQYLTNLPALEFTAADRGLSVMPMCHINSVYYSFVFTYAGGTALVYNSVSFDAEHMIKTLSEMKVTFTSLVPTHYIMMLALREEIKGKYDVDCVKKLMISSAPARRDTKIDIMGYFKNSQLYEAYGSTEAGLVTLLKPSEQFEKLGSIGREIAGTDIIKLLDEDGKEVGVNQVGELYSRTPMVFSEYWKNPEQTKAAFVGEYFSAGDMAYRDEQGYYYLVDRKKNMIITGGENVYPSEVENCLGGHAAVKDVAVIGVPDAKWGESATAVAILHQGYEPSPELAKEILDYTKNKIAGFKRPKVLEFIAEADMPRTDTGKILHRILRERYGHWSQQKG